MPVLVVEAGGLGLWIAEQRSDAGTIDGERHGDVDLGARKEVGLRGIGKGELHAFWQLGAAGARMAEAFATSLKPAQVARQDVEFVLQNAASPHGHGHLVIRNAEAFALQVLRVILTDTGAVAHDQVGVAEVAIVEDGQRQVREALGAFDQVRGERHFGNVVALVLDLFEEEARNGGVWRWRGIRLVVESNPRWFDFAADERQDAIVRSDREAQGKV